jgi:hypothetical protein
LLTDQTREVLVQLGPKNGSSSCAVHALGLYHRTACWITINYFRKHPLDPGTPIFCRWIIMSSQHMWPPVHSTAHVWPLVHSTAHVWPPVHSTAHVAPHAFHSTCEPHAFHSTCVAPCAFHSIIPAPPPYQEKVKRCNLPKFYNRAGGSILTYLARANFFVWTREIFQSLQGSEFVHLQSSVVKARQGLHC